MKALLHGPLMIFIIQALAIVSLSRLFGVGARLLRQPLVIAEVVAGIALGPSLFGWLLPDVSAVIFPPDSLEYLGLLAQLGLVLFMFLVGLEFDPRLLRGRARASVAISHTSIVVPFALGAVAAFYFYPRVSSPAVPFTTFCLFMGVAMSITAFPVLARILLESRLLRTRIGSIAITCAAVDDVTAWCILAFIVAIVRASGVPAAVWTTVFALTYIAFMMLAVRPFMRRVAERRRNETGLSQNIVAAMLGLLLISAFVTELIGIHALFGAFIFGAILPKEHGFARGLAEKIEDLVVILFLPLFFAFSGLRTQIGLLDSASDWAMCLLVTVIACAGKFGGSAVAARLTGLGWRESSVIGILMNTRGLMELVVLNIGLDLGVISPKLFTMMVLMALVTTFMTSPILERIYPLKERAEQDAGARESLPPAAAGEGYVVVLCSRYETTGPAMATLGAALAGNSAAGDRLYALRLVRPADRASFVLDQQQPSAESAMAPLIERAKELSVAVRPLSFVSTQPSRDICAVADDKRAKLVLLGWHEPLLGDAVLGGTVHEVMQDTRADVGVLVDRGLERIRRVLVPYLGGPHDDAAMALSRRIATNAGAQIKLLHLIDGSDPLEAALEESRQGYDLVVVGVGAEWGLEHRPFGLQAEHLIERCPASLLIVRRRMAEQRAPAVADASFANA